MSNNSNSVTDQFQLLKQLPFVFWKWAEEKKYLETCVLEHTGDSSAQESKICLE